MDLKHSRFEMVFGGIGGQGVVLAANLVGNAASVEYPHVAVSVNYGPEARGSLTSADAVVSDSPIDYPHAESMDVLVVMAQTGWDKLSHRVKPQGLVIIDSTLAKAGSGVPGMRTVCVPATELARSRLSDAAMANIILVGGLIESVPGLLRRESVDRSLRAVLPEGLMKRAGQALELGCEAARGGVPAGR
jgi:2-oxoglutarate ferredoxin oxidoreductase subunit gamma